MIAADRDETYQAGTDTARAEGWPNDCPHPPDSEARAVWLEGFYAAAEQMREAWEL